MNVQNITDLLVSLFVVVVPVIGGFVTKKVLANKKLISLLQTAEPLAKTGVVLAEQAGVTNYLTSEAKKSKAVAYVLAELKNLGFTTADETTIASVVEKQFAESKQAIEAAYPQKTTQQVAQEQADAEAKAKAADENAALKKEVDGLKTLVGILQGGSIRTTTGQVTSATSAAPAPVSTGSAVNSAGTIAIDIPAVGSDSSVTK